MRAGSVRSKSTCGWLTTALAAAGMMCLLPAESAAQLNGQNIKGDAGLKSGSQAPPGAYVAVPLWFYSADKLRDRNGDTLLSGSLDSTVFGVALNVVTPKKLFGANYGFLVALPWAHNRLQGTHDFTSKSGIALTDMFIQPISLGWHAPRADFILGYGLYLPTGRYEDGASDNTGLGMWAHEFIAGTTVYLNESKSLHVATTMAYDIQSEKKDSSTKVGDILNLEGGVGADFLGGGLSVGMAYYGTFKVSADRFDSLLPGLLIRGKNRVWGIGPEVTLALASKSMVYGFVTVRYQWEAGGRTTTTGGAWNILASFPLKPIRIE
jgi:hypothetical protein